MTNRPEPPESVTTGLTVAAVIAAMACCALPFLVAAGVFASAGVALRNLAILALGAGALGWAITRAIRTLRARDRTTDSAEHTRT